MRFNKPVIYGTSYKGKLYIGQHIGNNRDYYGGGVIIKNIIKSGNKHKLKTKVIEYVKDVNLLNEREIYWIKKLKPQLNLAPGGEGGDRSMFFTKEILKSKSEKMKAFVRNKEWCENIRKSKQGVKLSDYQRQKMSEAHKGKVLSEEHKNNIRKGFSKIKNTKKYKKNLSKAVKLWWAKRKGEVI